VRLACLEDDAQGQELEVLWEIEPDARVVEAEAWARLGERGFDPAEQFAACYHVLRWNCGYRGRSGVVPVAVAGGHSD
jgi:hypothetical protein